MRIPIYFGIYTRGLLERPVGFVATRFFCLQGLPVFPVGGVVAQPDATGQLALYPGPMSLASVAAAYFKAWGFVVACGAGALVADYLSTPSNPMVIAVAAAAVTMVLLIGVCSSWLVLGMRSPRLSAGRLLLAVGLPAALLLGAYGWGWVKRAERCHYQAYRPICGVPEPDLALPARSPLPTTTTVSLAAPSPPSPAVAERTKLMRSLYAGLHVVDTNDQAKSWPAQKCDNAAIKKAIAGKSAVVLHTTYAYGLALDAAFRKDPPAPTTKQAHFTSTSLKTLGRAEDGALATTMGEIGSHPYFALIDILTATNPVRPVGKKPGTAGSITGRVALFDTSSGAFMCATDLLSAKYVPKATDPEDKDGLGDAFKKQIMVALKKIAPDLEIDL